MKFFDLELGGLGQKVVVETTGGDLMFVGGKILKECKASTEEFGEGFLAFVSDNTRCSQTRGVTAYRKCIEK